MAYEYNKYKTNLEGLKDTLDKWGVAIIPKVLNGEECEDMKNGIWNYLEHISQTWDIPIKRDIQKKGERELIINNSWKQFYKLLPLHSMLLKNWGIGHSQVCWDLRQKEKILKIFAHLYDTTTDNLLVSFDGFSFCPPPEKTNRGWEVKNKSWLHSDQSYTNSDFKCIQSWVTAYDVNEGDGTLMFLERSHKFHKQFAEYFNVQSKKDWYLLDKDNIHFYEHINRCKRIKIKCPKGSLVLWDSRTIHCGSQPMKGRINHDFRMVVYLCYQPRDKATKKQLEKRRKAFEELRTTSHWVLNCKLNAINPRSYGRELPKITPIDKPNVSKMELIG